MQRSERAVLVGIVTAIGLGLRCALIATSEVVAPLRADAGQYAQYAQNLVEHGVFSLATGAAPAPDSFRSPGYPWFLAICRWLAGADGWYGLARWLQAVLGALLVPLTFAIARAALPYAAAVGAAAYVALSPHLVVVCGYVLTETVFAVAIAAAFLTIARASRRGGAGRFAVAGLAFGCAALVNETAILLPLLLAFAGRRRWGGRRALALLCAALLPISAWTARNVSQDLARTGSDRALATLSHGSYPGLFFATEQYRNYPYREDPEQPAYGESWARFRTVFAARFAARPWRYLSWYLFEKPAWLWSWAIVQGAGDIYVYQLRRSPFEDQPVLELVRQLFCWLHWPFAVLAVAGAWRTLRRGRLQPLAVALAGFTVAYSLFLPDPRYLLPLRSLQAVAAAAACVWAWRRLRSLLNQARTRTCGAAAPAAAGAPAVD